jgi:Fe-S-cluster containining protein
VRVFAVDEDRMSAEALALTRFDEDRRFMRFEDGHCAALVLDAKTNTASCRIHPERPDACRWLERGGGECLSHVAAKRQWVQLRILRA